MKENCPACGYEYKLNKKSLIATFEDFHNTPGFSFVCSNCSHILVKKGIDFKLQFEEEYK